MLLVYISLTNFVHYYALCAILTHIEPNLMVLGSM